METCIRIVALHPILCSDERVRFNFIRFNGVVDLLLHGVDDIPTFFGGPNTDHDKYYPEPSSQKEFDWYGMIQRVSTVQYSSVSQHV